MVRTLVTLLCLAFLLSAGEPEKPKVPAGERTRTVASDSLGVYSSAKRGISEAPLFLLRKGDKVRITAQEGGLVAITAPDGRSGWLEKKGLADENRQSLILDELKVFGFLDNPEPVYILDMEDDNYKPIRVSKDFIYDPDLMRNVNKENFEWENEIYYYKDNKFKGEAVNPPATNKAIKGKP